MMIQCQTWLAPDAAILKRKEEKRVEDGVYVRRDETATQQGSWSQTMQSRLSKLPDSPLSSSPLLNTADSFSLQPQWRSFFRKQKAGASVLNPSDKGRLAFLLWYRQAERGISHQILQSPAPARRKTIAELRHTRDDVRTLQRLTAANPEARRGLGQSRAIQMGTPLSQKQRTKSQTYISLCDDKAPTRVCNARRKISALNSCSFAQLHKMQSVSVQTEQISGTNILINATYNIFSK